MRYDLYKYSGVEWIGEIPIHWDIKKNKYFTQPQKNKSEKGEEELLSVSEKFGVITRKSIRDDQENLTRSESLVGYLKVKKGELVSNIMLMWKRGLGVSEHNGIVSPSYSVFSFLNSEPKYFHYLFRTDQYVSEFRRNSTGVIESRLRLYDDSFGSLKSHFPPLSEQKKIVYFLDQKTTQIDKLLKKIEQKIELLKEQRTSLINEVVTKGLNPNVEMKDCGVEWIGEIPSHWTVSKIMFISTKVTDGSHYSPETVDIGKLYVTVSNVTKENNIDFESCSKISEESYLDLEKNGCRPKKGDVLITKDGTIGRGLVVGDFNDYVILSSIGLIRFSEKIFSKYGLYYLLSGLNIDQMYSHVRGSGITRLTINLIKNLLFVIPSYPEQQQIVEYLDEQTQLIDKTVSIEEKRIELLKEYRQSLISEVVTGKRKVV